MARDLNDCKFIGRLGQDPETRFTGKGDPVCSFSIAVGESWIDKNTGQKQEKTEWVNITAWRGLGEVCQKYLTKGSQVYVSGKFKTDTYEKDGVKRHSTSIQLVDMQMLGGKSGAQGQSSAPNGQAYAQASGGGSSASQGPEADFEDDIPF